MPLLSVVIPCFNERETLLLLLETVERAEPRDKEIILVDDGSTDGTTELIRSVVEPEGRARCVYHAKNKGKGAALRSGIALAVGDIVIIQDADLEYDPKEYPFLIQPIVDDLADVVFGSRFQGSRPHRVGMFWHAVGNRLLTITSNMFSNLTLTDMETCYKAFRREIVHRFVIEEDRFGFEPEITAKVALTGCRVYEVGVSYHGRTYEQGKKIGWKDGVSALRCILKYNIRGRILGK